MINRTCGSGRSVWICRKSQTLSWVQALHRAGLRPGGHFVVAGSGSSPAPGSEADTLTPASQGSLSHDLSRGRLCDLNLWNALQNVKIKQNSSVMYSNGVEWSNLKHLLNPKLPKLVNLSATYSLVKYLDIEVIEPSKSIVLTYSLSWCQILLPYIY